MPNAPPISDDATHERHDSRIGTQWLERQIRKHRDGDDRDVAGMRAHGIDDELMRGTRIEGAIRTHVRTQPTECIRTVNVRGRNAQHTAQRNRRAARNRRIDPEALGKIERVARDGLNRSVAGDGRDALERYGPMTMEKKQRERIVDAGIRIKNNTRHLSALMLRPSLSSQRVPRQPELVEGLHQSSRLWRWFDKLTMTGITDRCAWYRS